MTPRQKKITEKVLSLIDWLDKSCTGSMSDLEDRFAYDLRSKLDEIKLESFAAEQLEEEEDHPGQNVEEKYYEFVSKKLKKDGF